MDSNKSFRDMFAEKVLSKPVSEEISILTLRTARSKFCGNPQTPLVHKAWMTFGTFNYFMQSFRFDCVYRWIPKDNTNGYQMAVYWNAGLFVVADIIDHRVSTVRMYGLFKPDNPYKQHGLSSFLPLDLSAAEPGDAPDQDSACNLAYFVEQEVRQDLFQLILDLRQDGQFLPTWPHKLRLWERVNATASCDLRVPCPEGGLTRLSTDELRTLSQVRLHALPQPVMMSIGLMPDIQ